MPMLLLLEIVLVLLVCFSCECCSVAAAAAAADASVLVVCGSFFMMREVMQTFGLADGKGLGFRV